MSSSHPRSQKASANKRKTDPSDFVDRLGLSLRVSQDDLDNLNALRMLLVKSGRKGVDSRIFRIALQKLSIRTAEERAEFLKLFDELDEFDSRRRPALGD
jgi:hypothetical protein